ncbi:11583_t:CDS:2 [Entrophospora sp. SA101]|nr:11583_t:CDS:2 [Entrophospora sp. SA101]
MSHLFPNEDVPMQANGSVNILEVVKSVVRTFDKNTIAQGSFRSYKSSNHLCIDSKKRAKVPRESVYDAEMYRILHNWLVKVHGFEITGQWHLESICADGDFHHFYCDLTIKKHDATNPVAILELLATVSQPKLDNHFEQVFKYAEQLCPLEVWIVHFSREDAVVTDPYWPCNELQDKGLNVIHLWHNKEFTNVRMSSRSLDAIGLCPCIPYIIKVNRRIYLPNLTESVPSIKRPESLTSKVWNAVKADIIPDEKKFLGVTPCKLKNPVSLDQFKLRYSKEFSEFIKEYNRYPPDIEFRIRTYEEYYIPYDWIGSKKNQLHDRLQNYVIELLRQRGYRVVHGNSWYVMVKWIENPDCYANKTYPNIVRI